MNKNNIEKNLIVKSNQLIEASYRLSTQEQRLILLIASMIKPDDDNFQTYQIHVKEFNDIVGIKDEAGYVKTKILTKKLLSRILEVKSDKSLLQISWLSSAEYFEGKGYVELSFDPKLKPYLLQIKKYFTQYRLKDVIRLKKFYSVRLYEILKQYEKIGKRTLSINDFRYILGLKDDEYRLYGHIKSRIILPAQVELKERTDLRFEFEEHKKSRKVSGITFFIYKNEKFVACEVFSESETHDLKAIDCQTNPIFEKLVSYFCLTESQAWSVINEFGSDRIEDNLLYVEDRYSKGLVNDIAPYTIKAIQEDYRLKKSRFDSDKENANKEKERVAALKEFSEQLEIEYRDLRMGLVSKIKETISEEELKAIEDEVDYEIKSKGQTGPGSRLLRKVALEKKLARKAGLQDYEEWRETRIKEVFN